MTAATRERLISAGLQLFTRYGIGQVGLDRILRQAELTKTTFYNHFSGKEELIREVISRHESELRDRLLSGVTRRAGDDPRGRLLAVFDVLAELHAEDGPAASLLVNAIIEFPSSNDPT
ncbi:MAG: TetR/AcrR family transcriptional regulator, partial [Planctomycetota bacterium]